MADVRRADVRWLAATKNESTQEEVTRMSRAIEAMEAEIETLHASQLETLQEQREVLIKVSAYLTQSPDGRVFESQTPPQIINIFFLDLW